MYNRQKAVEYALKWANDRNRIYADFAKMGGDCTNFVSQALSAGGIEMNFNRLGWYYVSLNSRAPAWSGVREFYSFAVSNKAKGVRAKEVGVEQVRVGDVVQISNGVRFHHSMIITKIVDYSYDGIFITTHDMDSKNRRLSTYNFKAIRFLHILN